MTGVGMGGMGSRSWGVFETMVGKEAYGGNNTKGLRTRGTI